MLSVSLSLSSKRSNLQEEEELHPCDEVSLPGGTVPPQKEEKKDERKAQSMESLGGQCSHPLLKKTTQPTIYWACTHVMHSLLYPLTFFCISLFCSTVISSSKHPDLVTLPKSLKQAVSFSSSALQTIKKDLEEHLENRYSVNCSYSVYTFNTLIVHCPTSYRP